MPTWCPFFLAALVRPSKRLLFTHLPGLMNVCATWLPLLGSRTYGARHTVLRPVFHSASHYHLLMFFFRNLLLLWRLHMLLAPFIMKLADARQIVDIHSRPGWFQACQALQGRAQTFPGGHLSSNSAFRFLFSTSRLKHHSRPSRRQDVNCTCDDS